MILVIVVGRHLHVSNPDQRAVGAAVPTARSMRVLTRRMYGRASEYSACQSVDEKIEAPSQSALCAVLRIPKAPQSPMLRVKGMFQG